MVNFEKYRLCNYLVIKYQINLSCYKVERNLRLVNDSLTFLVDKSLSEKYRNAMASWSRSIISSCDDLNQFKSA